MQRAFHTLDDEICMNTAVWKVEFKNKFVTQKPTMRGLLGWSKGPKSVVRKIAVAWP